MFHCDNQDHKNHDNLPPGERVFSEQFLFSWENTVEMFNCSTTSLDLLYENKLLYLWEKYNTMQAKVSLVISFKNLSEKFLNLSRPPLYI